MTRGAEQRDFVVVGAGLLGLAAGRALARRGREVTVLEQARVGHDGGGSSGSCRIFRLGYSDPAYVRAARRAADFWAELESESGQTILFPTPQLSFGAGLAGIEAALRAAGAPGELLPAAEAAARFPGLAAGGPALLEPGSCVTAADTALAALAAAVPDLRTGVRVTGLADDGRRVRVQTSDGPLSARVVIVCAGPWTAGLLAPRSGAGPEGAAWPSAIPSTATLEQAAFLAPASAPEPATAPAATARAGTAPAATAPAGTAPTDTAPPGTAPPGTAPPGTAPPATASGTAPADAEAAPPRLPIFICHDRQSPYGLPVPGSALYKTGIHPSGPAIRAGQQHQSPDPELARRLRDVARRYLPGLDPHPVRTERCVYDNSPDEDFIVDRVGNIVIGCGTSGHGFKFGPLLGEWLAGLATEGRPVLADGRPLLPGDNQLPDNRLPDTLLPGDTPLPDSPLTSGRFALERFSRPAAGSGSR